jgi:hypothetical protein
MNKKIALFTILMSSLTAVRLCAEGLLVNKSGGTLWVNVGDAPAKKQEGILSPRGYKVIKNGENKTWSYTFGNFQTWLSEKAKLWIQQPNGTIYGFTFPTFQSIDKITINRPMSIILTGKEVGLSTIVGMPAKMVDKPIIGEKFIP